MINNDHLTRQLEIIPLGVLANPITIIGAGAIGGWVALSLAKMGAEKISVWDFDTVTVENMNCQFYRLADIGKPKVLALQALIRDFTGTEIEARNEKYSHGVFSGVVVCAVDSMAIRKTIWENHKGKSPFTRALIDPRMGAEEALLYVMSPMVKRDQTAYEKTLYSDAEAVAERCTAKSTIYTANLLAGLVVKAVKDLWTGKPFTRVVNWSIASNEMLSFPGSL